MHPVSILLGPFAAYGNLAQLGTANQIVFWAICLVIACAIWCGVRYRDTGAWFVAVFLWMLVGGMAFLHRLAHET